MKTKLLHVIFLLTIGIVNAQNVIYVNQNATGNNDGTSWADAYVLLESAVTSATPNTDIWIASGTYKPNLPGGSRFSTFLISQPNIGLYGGFAGTETQLSQRIYGQNETILSGDLNGNDNANIEYFEPTRLDNSYCVIRILNLSDGIVLDRLTITGGHSNAANNVDGAGIRVGTTDLTVTDCKIYRNVARNRGAGIYLSLGGGNGTQRTFEIKRCQFIENLSREGAGIHFTEDTNDALNFRVRNSLFLRNKTTNIGDPGNSGSSCFFSSNGNYAGDWTNNTSAFNTDDGTFHSGLQSVINQRTTLTVSSPATNGQTFFIYNSIFYNNTVFNGNPLPGLGFNNSSTPLFNISHSTDEGGFANTLTSAGHTWTAVNTSNPQFLNTSNDNFRLSGASPARDTGNVNAPFGSLDVEHNPRNQGFTIDRGAYEATPIPPGTIVYVDQDATGANDGSSWTDAFTDLHSALNTVAFQGQIWIAEGHYRPSPTGFRTESFIVNTAEIEIYGGFAGTESQLSERIYGMNTTYIDGDNFGDDNGASLDYISQNRVNDNAFNVIKITANGTGALFDSVFITGGHSSSGTSALVAGAAILVDNSVNSLTLNKVIVADHVARNTGGAIHWTPNSDAQFTITNSRFARNFSRNGGAIFFGTSSPGNYELEIINSIFELNLAEDIGNVQGRAGSSLYATVNNASATLTSNLINNTFAVNTDAGTILTPSQRTTVAVGEISGSAITNVYNCLFWGNRNLNAPGTNTANALGSLSFPLGTWDVSHSLDEQGFNSISTQSNVTVNSIVTQYPLFALTSNSNHQFSLTSGSPAIDAGDNSLVPSTSISDFLNNQRIHNSNVDIGAYEFGSPALGIDSFIDESTITIFPNPASNIINVNSEKAITEIIIYDVLGKKVLSSNYKSINIEKLKTGTYFIELSLKGNRKKVKRFIKF